MFQEPQKCTLILLSLQQKLEVILPAYYQNMSAKHWVAGLVELKETLALFEKSQTMGRAKAALLGRFARRALCHQY